MYNEICKHEELKYFKETDKVVCLKCGEDFHKTIITGSPAPFIIPYTPPTPMPDYPIYPTVTWSNVNN